MLHYGKKCLFWSFIIFGYLSFTTVMWQKIGFNSCECIKFWNITNFHVFHVWGKCILRCNDTAFFLNLFPFFDFARQLLSTLVTSSNLCNQALLFMELHLLQATQPMHYACVYSGINCTDQVINLVPSLNKYSC